MPKEEQPKHEQPPAHLIWANPGGKAETTTIHERVTVTQTITATVPAAGASHTVTVGGPGGLIFQPDQLHGVPVGDTIIFEFLSQNHTVTQSPFDTPCDALPEGMDSGFMANPNNTVVPPPQVAMQVMGDAPLWFYCAQGNHCGQGMVFSVNPTAEKTHAMFQQKAIEQKGDGAASPITGGETAPPPAADAPPAAAPPAEGGVGNVPGQGQIVDGSCVCMVSCSASGFPSAQQGLNARGGVAGKFLSSFPIQSTLSLTSSLQALSP
ncbi:Cupredoxin [Sarocladium strictum]